MPTYHLKSLISVSIPSTHFALYHYILGPLCNKLEVMCKSLLLLTSCRSLCHFCLPYEPRSTKSKWMLLVQVIAYFFVSYCYLRTKFGTEMSYISITHPTLVNIVNNCRQLSSEAQKKPILHQQNCQNLLTGSNNPAAAETAEHV